MSSSLNQTDIDQAKIDQEVSDLRRKRRLERVKQRQVEKEEKEKGGFLDRVFSDPIYKWAGYLVILLILAALGLAIYFIYSYVAHKATSPDAGGKSFRETFVDFFSNEFSKENIFSLNFVNDMITVFVFCFVLLLAFGDQRSFVKNKHTDYKAVIISLGVLGTFTGIFLGLYSFDVADIEGSVPKLLGGLKTAFLTSIFGLGSSVILTYIQTASNVGAQSEVILLRDMTESLASLDDGQEILEKQQAAISSMSSNLKAMLDPSKISSEATQIMAKHMNTMVETQEETLKQIRSLQANFKNEGAKKEPSLFATNSASSLGEPPKRDLFS